MYSKFSLLTIYTFSWTTVHKFWIQNFPSHIPALKSPVCSLSYSLSFFLSLSLNQLQSSNNKKLLKCKQTIQIATFNVRTLNRIGQLPELTASAVEHKIDIICIQEHRYTHNEDIKYHDTDNGWTLATVSTWKNSVNATVGGVGILIGPRALKSLNSVESIPPRMIATFNGNPGATIVCYSPTNVSEETELVAFYDELSSLVCSILKHNILVRWMKGCILPFPKKGDLGLAKNYRGITLTSKAAKI